MPSRSSSASFCSSSSRSSASRSTESSDPSGGIAAPGGTRMPPGGPLMFSRVLVANRGEIAVRIIRALHELGVEAVAVYSTADAGTLHTRLADRAVCIGPPSATESYLNLASVVAAAETTHCDAVHPGYGFLSENPDFVKACEENNLVFVGPDADVMSRMGDKVVAKRELAEAGLPLVPGTEAVEADEARAGAAEIGFPVLLKASAGWGGEGMRLRGTT